ncbi:MAG TPA: sugar ABC transporter substrate-binding protein [Armatimonadota bacterium]|jgi:multiple sugar transport system substrate-binding protein
MERETLSKFGVLLLILSSLGCAVYFSRPLPPSGKTVIRFLTYETGQGQMDMVNAIKRDFEKANPDIEVQVEFNSMARDKIYVETASGTEPDAFYAVTDDIPRLAIKGAIEPLNELIARDKASNLNIYFPEVVNALRYAPPYLKIPRAKQELYAYPIHFSTDILFYNKDLFEKAGVPFPTDKWTWAQMIEAARKLTVKDDRGRITQFGMFLPDTATTIEGNGGHVFNSDYTRCLIASPQALEAVETLRALRFKDHIAPTPAQVQETSSMQMFKLGQIAMLPGRTYMTVDFNKITDFKYDATLMPGMKFNVERLAVGGVCISRHSDAQHKAAAYRWAKFYCSPEGGQAILGCEKNCVTAVKALALSPKYFLKPPPANSRVLVDSLYDSRITIPPIVGASEYINGIATPSTDDMLRTEHMDIAAALRNYQAATNKLLAKEPKGPTR